MPMTVLSQNGSKDCKELYTSLQNCDKSDALKSKIILDYEFKLNKQLVLIKSKDVEIIETNKKVTFYKDKIIEKDASIVEKDKTIAERNVKIDNLKKSKKYYFSGGALFIIALKLLIK
jgi:hypothetical protein